MVSMKRLGASTAVAAVGFLSFGSSADAATANASKDLDLNGYVATVSLSGEALCDTATGTSSAKWTAKVHGDALVFSVAFTGSIVDSKSHSNPAGGAADLVSTSTAAATSGTTATATVAFTVTPGTTVTPAVAQTGSLTATVDIPTCVNQVALDKAAADAAAAKAAADKVVADAAAAKAAADKAAADAATAKTASDKAAADAAAKVAADAASAAAAKAAAAAAAAKTTVLASTALPATGGNSGIIAGTAMALLAAGISLISLDKKRKLHA